METTSDSLTTFQPILTQTNPTKIPLPVPPPFSPSRIGSGTSLVTNLETVIEAESSSKYKSVRFLASGRWGAQIYSHKKKKNLWLGSFNEHHEAVWAYDIADLRIHGRNAMTNNNNNTSLSEDELNFINSKSEDELADILKRHTYYSQLRSFINRKHASSRHLLFEKVVCASDVAKLGVLYIPKRLAEKHFPVPLALSSVNKKSLVFDFEDGDGKVWRFGFSLRKCGTFHNKYTFTKDWIRFVKDKNLKAGDTVLFYRSTTFENHLYIDFKRTSGQTTNGSLSGFGSVQKIRLFGVDINM